MNSDACFIVSHLWQLMMSSTSKWNHRLPLIADGVVDESIHNYFLLICLQLVNLIFCFSSLQPLIFYPSTTKLTSLINIVDLSINQFGKRGEIIDGNCQRVMDPFIQTHLPHKSTSTHSKLACSLSLNFDLIFFIN